MMIQREGRKRGEIQGFKYSQEKKFIELLLLIPFFCCLGDTAVYGHS